YKCLILRNFSFTKAQYQARILRPASGPANLATRHWTEAFFVIGFAPAKNCPGAARRRKVVKTSWDKAYSDYPGITHKVPTTYPQALALQSPPDRIILYPDRSEPLDVGVRAKSHTQVNRQIQANFTY
ncbi:hypothetical protein, partial [Pseudomonas sp. ES1]|uniref:hypothetical protein n=1 Tax=Pseudomonas sp. ES1 TaxID=3424775 RepID=UPI003D35803B